MSKPAFIVDGFTEKLVIGNICPGKPVSRTDLNGKSVTLEAIANKVASLIRLFNNRHYPIIVLIDRENRTETCEEIIDELKTRLNDLDLEDQDIRIAVADRMFENWIIADWENLETNEAKPIKTDGLKGTTILKKMLGSYNKTTDGVELFTNCTPSNIYNNSESFRKFIDSLEDVSCNYTEFDK